MHARTRTAIALTVALTAGSATLLTGCVPTATTTAAGTTSAAPSGGAVPLSGSKSAPSSSSPSAAPTSPSPSSSVPSVPSVNGTAHNGLTISNGTAQVLMNGTAVDFGVIVRDLAWSPDGAKAAFIDGSGNLDVANPDGSGRVVVAANPGGQVWSHPTWQTTKANAQYQMPARDNLIFAAATNGVTRLESVAATAAHGTPSVLTLSAEPGANVPQLPQTGNVWPSGGGPTGTAVYANSGTGEVYIRDDYLRQQGGAFTAGSEPALSPDGNALVFVRSVGGHDHLFEESLGSSSLAAKDLTPNATTDYTEPGWSPDGRTVAVRTPSGIDTLPADGSAAPTSVSTFTGLPAYRA